MGSGRDEKPRDTLSRRRFSIITGLKDNRNLRFYVSWRERIHCFYICKFAGRRLPVASSAGTEHEHDDVQRSTGRSVPSVEPRLDERSVTDLGAISAQHTRDVTHLSGDREIREGHRDLMLTPSPTIFLSSLLHCDKTQGDPFPTPSVSRKTFVLSTVSLLVTKEHVDRTRDRNEILPLPFRSMYQHVEITCRPTEIVKLIRHKVTGTYRKSVIVAVYCFLPFIAQTSVRLSNEYVT